MCKHFVEAGATLRLVSLYRNGVCLSVSRRYGDPCGSCLRCAKASTVCAKAAVCLRPRASFVFVKVVPRSYSSSYSSWRATYARPNVRSGIRLVSRTPSSSGMKIWPILTRNPCQSLFATRGSDFDLDAFVLYVINYTWETMSSKAPIFKSVGWWRHVLCLCAILGFSTISGTRRLSNSSRTHWWWMVVALATNAWRHTTSCGCHMHARSVGRWCKFMNSTFLHLAKTNRMREVFCEKLVGVMR